VPGELQHAVPGDAGKDGSLEGRGYEGPVLVEAYVHRPHLIDVLLMDPIEPQHLRVPLLLGLVGRQQGGGIVGRGLGLAQPSTDGSDVLARGHEADGVEAFLVVGTHRPGDDEEGVLLRDPDADVVLGGEGEGTDVQGGALLAGYPLLI